MTTYITLCKLPERHVTDRELRSLYNRNRAKRTRMSDESGYAFELDCAQWDIEIEARKRGITLPRIKR